MNLTTFELLTKILGMKTEVRGREKKEEGEGGREGGGKGGGRGQQGGTRRGGIYLVKSSITNIKEWKSVQRHKLESHKV